MLWSTVEDSCCSEGSWISTAIFWIEHAFFLSELQTRGWYKPHKFGHADLTQPNDNVTNTMKVEQQNDDLSCSQLFLYHTVVPLNQSQKGLKDGRLLVSSKLHMLSVHKFDSIWRFKFQGQWRRPICVGSLNFFYSVTNSSSTAVYIYMYI